MCYSGQCRYEDYMGDCNLSEFKLRGNGFPNDADCVIADEATVKREKIRREIGLKMNKMIVNKLISTCKTTTFTQWDAWTITGDKLYIHYKHGWLTVMKVCDIWPSCDCIENQSCGNEIFEKCLDSQEKNGELYDSRLIMILEKFAGINFTEEILKRNKIVNKNNPSLIESFRVIDKAIKATENE